jgi:hypothetical protein
MELVGVGGDQLSAPPGDELRIQIAAEPASPPEER